MASHIDNDVRQAIASFQAGKLDDAAGQFKDVLRQDPTHLAALNILGIVLIHLKKYDEAERYLQSALAINSKSDATLSNYGLVLRALNRPGEALERFSQALAINPSVPETWNSRGTVFDDLKRYGEAIADFDKAIALHPNYPETLCNKGKSLAKLKRYDEALAAYDKALALKPDFAAAWLGRGNICLALKRNEEALAAYDKAMALRSDLVEVWLGRGDAFAALKRNQDALAAFNQAVALNPGAARAWLGRAQTLQMLNQADEAVAAYRHALELGADSESVKYYLAALGADEPPPASPQSYITNLFDWHADSFDRVLVGDLKYQTPVLLGNAIAPLVGPNTLDILDLGCGTGLMGERLRPFARTLTGVDLSANMLERARQRGIYDELACSDIVQFLQVQDRKFDLVAATDVFVYIGDLSAIFREVRDALRDKGLFCFSVESTEEADFVLRSSKRYAHSIGYLQRLAEQSRFVVETIEPHVVRREAEANIDGYLVIMRGSQEI